MSQDTLKGTVQMLFDINNMRASLGKEVVMSYQKLLQAVELLELRSSSLKRKI